MGTDFGLLFQGISNSSSSECHIYLGNYEKSYNNVLFTVFIIGFLGSECSQPPNHKQGCALPSGSGSEHAAGSWDPGPCRARCPPSPGPGVSCRAPGSPECPPPQITQVRMALHTAWTRKKPGLVVLTTTCPAQQAGPRKDEILGQQTFTLLCLAQMLKNPPAM